MSAVRRGTCAEPGPRDLHCTEHPGHRYSHYDAGEDESWTGRGIDPMQPHACEDPDCPDREEAMTDGRV